jgi:hypothetical protein
MAVSTTEVTALNHFYVFSSVIRIIYAVDVSLINLICIVGGGVQTGEFGGMNGRGNQSTQRKPALTPLCPPQIPLDQTRD